MADERELNFKDVILHPRMCALEHRKDADITVQLGKWKFASPVIPANMPAIIDDARYMQFIEKSWFAIYPRLAGTESVSQYIEASCDYNPTLPISISIGVTDDWIIFLQKMAIQKVELDFITIDVAHSHSAQCERMIKNVKRFYPEAFLIVGNGCSTEWIDWLCNMGVQGAKIGIGVSTACRTRQFTGFGSTTYSDLVRCAKVADGRIKIISDGGLTIDENGDVWIGDVAKAIQAGADMVMSGSLFKDCLDSPSLLGGYYGNASRTAKGDKHVEGAHLNVTTNGLTTEQMMELISDSLKSSVSYSGGTKLNDLREAMIKTI